MNTYLDGALNAGAHPLVLIERVSFESVFILQMWKMWKIFCMQAICARTPRWRPQRRRPPAGPDMSSSLLFILQMCKMWKIIWIKAVSAHSPRWRPQSVSGWSILTGEGADGGSQPRVELTPGGQFPKFWRVLSCQSVPPGKQTNIRHVEQQLWPTTFSESTW